MTSHKFKRSIIATGLVVFSILIMACAGNANRQAPAPDTAGSRNAQANSNRTVEPGDTSPDEFEGRDGSVIRAGFDVAPALLREIRTAEQNGFDRVVFQFEGDDIPNYTIQYSKEPVQCGSGKAVQVAGAGKMEVKFNSSNAHTEAGQPTIKDRERRLNQPILKELEISCDFEAQVGVVLGVSAPNRYRVLDLYKPTRVVIDIKHKND
jgi:hypothetical protein